MNGFNDICITQVASTVLSLLGVSPDEKMALPVSEVIAGAQEKFSGEKSIMPTNLLMIQSSSLISSPMCTVHATA